MKKFAIYFASAVFACIMAIALNSQSQITEDYVISDFEDLFLGPDSYWNGDDLSGGFISGKVFFPNYYNPEWFSWDGWAYSNMADDSTAGFLNQYSAITAAGFDPEGSEGVNYGVAYLTSDWVTYEKIPVTFKLNDNQKHLVEGLFVTNSTFAALSMENGDSYSKKFGGESGNDSDWFKLTTWGYIDGNETDSLYFYLADYRFENNEDDYIVTSWEWFELSSLGSVDSLSFLLSSTDNGDFGMNTPSYFCIDHVTVAIGDTTGIKLPTPNFGIQVFPNPSNGVLQITTLDGTPLKLEIRDMAGNIIFKEDEFDPHNKVDLGEIPVGLYIIRLSNKTGTAVQKLIIQ